MKIFVTGAALKAALFQAGKQDIRHYLNGVCLEAMPKETRVIATDGHRLSVIRVSAENEGVTVPVQIIVPRVTVESMKLSKAQLKNAIVIEGPSDNGEYRATGTFGVAVFKPVEGTFPPYRRVVPVQVSGEVAQYDPAYLVDMQKAANMLDCKRVYVQHNGDSGAVITCDSPDFAGVIMPQRWKDKHGNDHKPTCIDWARS